VPDIPCVPVDVDAVAVDIGQVMSSTKVIVLPMTDRRASAHLLKEIHLA
jgi:hypothetical protein